MIHLTLDQFHEPHDQFLITSDQFHLISYLKT